MAPVFRINMHVLSLVPRRVGVFSWLHLSSLCKNYVLFLPFLQKPYNDLCSFLFVC